MLIITVGLLLALFLVGPAHAAPIIGDGIADDTAALQSLIDTTPDYGTIQLLPGCKMRVTATLTLNSRRGLKIVGDGSLGGSGLNRPGTTKIIYDGPVDQPVLQADGSRDMTFTGFVIDGNSKANVGLRFLKTSASADIVSFNRLENMAVYAGASPRPNWIGLDICSQGITSNCEQFTVRAVSFNGGGGNSTGIAIGHGNSFTHTITESQISRHAVGISNTNGSFRATGNLFDHNGIDMRSVNSDPIYVESNRTEGANQFYKTLGAGGPAILTGNYFGSPGDSPGPYIDFSGSGTHATLTFIGNVFAGAPYALLTPFAGGSASLFSTGNVYDPRQVVNQQIASMDSFNSGFSSVNDSQKNDRLASVYGAGALRAFQGEIPHVLLHNRDYIGGYTTDGKRRKFAGIEQDDNLRLGDERLSVRIRSNLTIPNAPKDGDQWIECSGVSPNRTCSQKVRDGGVVYTLGQSPAH